LGKGKWPLSDERMTRLMLDTNVFNRMQSGQTPLTAFEGHELYITHIQRDELNRTKDRTLAEKFLNIVSMVNPELAPTQTGIWGDSRWGQFKWSNGKTYEKMLDRLKFLDAAKNKKSNESLNQSRDVRISETAIENDFTLVSTDRKLINLTTEFNGKAIHLDDFDLFENP
jgi:hypothetical protein